LQEIEQRKKGPRKEENRKGKVVSKQKAEEKRKEKAEKD